MKYNSPHPALWRSAGCSWHTLPCQNWQIDIGPCPHPSLSLTDGSREDSSHGPCSHRTGSIGGMQDKEIISLLNHKSQQKRKRKWKWIWCSLYSWRARHHSEEIFEKQRLWLTSITSRSVASSVTPVWGQRVILNLAPSNSCLLELEKPLRVVSMSNR